MYDKRNRLFMEYENIKEQSALSSTCIICGREVDHEYGTAKVCYMCKNAVNFVSDNFDKLCAVIQNNDK